MRALLVVLGCLLLASCGSSPPAVSTDANELPRISPIPITPSAGEVDQIFQAKIRGVPISGEDARLLAAASCVAFGQNPGTSVESAGRQLAAREGWTPSQGVVFVEAVVAVHCPEYRHGS
jgi:starvation-inducible outer membrane lipoprotein